MLLIFCKYELRKLRFSAVRSPRPAPCTKCVHHFPQFIHSIFLFVFKKSLLFSDGYAILFFAENNSPLRISSLLLFSFSSDRPEQAGIPLPTRSGLLFAFFRIRSANKTLKIRFPGTVSRICHLDAAGWHPIQFNGTHYIVKGERRQCGSRQPRSLRKSCP